jgi:hypothetical protein
MHWKKQLTTATRRARRKSKAKTFLTTETTEGTENTEKDKILFVFVFRRARRVAVVKCFFQV